MNIVTKRLIIIALTPKQLELWIDDLHQLEKELKCSYQGEPIEGVFKEIIEGQISKASEDSQYYLWHSFWFIMRKSDHKVVGCFDFKAKPNEKEEVEIGYGLGEAFEHHGYMSETVKAMCNWALQ